MYAFSGMATDGSRLFLKESGTTVTGGILVMAGKGLHLGAPKHFIQGSGPGGDDDNDDD
jgi:hypothetical protein